MTDKTNFKATFTLSQEGFDGDVVSHLTFEPLVDRANVDAAPICYEMMAVLAQHYLQMINVIDEDGELIDPDAFENQINLRVSTFGDKSRLN